MLCSFYNCKKGSEHLKRLEKYCAKNYVYLGYETVKPVFYQFMINNVPNYKEDYVKNTNNSSSEVGEVLSL